MHSALKEQLLGLKDLNLQMTKEATNLTKALKGDSKMQGNWGELVLERVLEKSGLEKDREYFVQQSFTLDDGSRVLPDVVLHLPYKFLRFLWKQFIVFCNLVWVHLSFQYGVHPFVFLVSRPGARRLITR